MGKEDKKKIYDNGWLLLATQDLKELRALFDLVYEQHRHPRTEIFQMYSSWIKRCCQLTRQIGLH
jgi:hypothetical protein